MTQFRSILFANFVLAAAFVAHSLRLEDDQDASIALAATARLIGKNESPSYRTPWVWTPFVLIEA